MKQIIKIYPNGSIKYKQYLNHINQLNGIKLIILMVDDLVLV